MFPALLASRVPAVEHVPFSEVLGALSRALDLTEGQPAGHTMRSCLIGMRLGRELGLDDATLSALYYALLLKDAGCSSNAARMCALFGADDSVVKRRMKLVDWHDRARLALATWRLAALGGTRHLSAAQFVHDQRDALAMVASQDGRFTVLAWSPCEGRVHAHRVEMLLM